ncbi:hypothetical protein [Bacillus sp. FJAT-27251]|uniref:hypothetical protein n=1 Tax=Bacillus sp. FJAT-27251 TaxID=1684142 RepID=UPI0006A7B3B8|nr:hypothetical protein [Bacillus sp. FJAT-27251]
MVKSDKYYQSFFENESSESNVIVPVRDIKGLTDTRGEENRSWWDHATLRAGKLSVTRFNSFGEKLKETNLEEFRQWFISDNFPLMKLVYYKEFNEYYVETDGNHRTVWAKLIDAEFIKAKVVNCRLNIQKFKEINRKEQQKLNNFIIIEKLKIDFEKYIQRYGFSINYGYIIYKGERLMLCYPPKLYYSNDQVVEFFKTYIREVKSNLRDLENEYHKLKKIPRILRSIYIILAMQIPRKRDTFITLSILIKKGWNII